MFDNKTSVLSFFWHVSNGAVPSYPSIDGSMLRTRIVHIYISLSQADDFVESHEVGIVALSLH